jgi:hypothetical protein
MANKGINLVDNLLGPPAPKVQPAMPKKPEY